MNHDAKHAVELSGTAFYIKKEDYSKLEWTIRPTCFEGRSIM